MFNLVPNWRDVARHAWSVRLLALVIALEILDTALWLFGSQIQLPQPWKAILSLAVSVAALVSRFVLQKQMKAKS